MCEVCWKGECLSIYMSSKAERRSEEQSERERERQMKYLHFRLFRLLFSAGARTCRECSSDTSNFPLQGDTVESVISVDQYKRIAEEIALTNEPSTSSTTSGINSSHFVIERLNRFSVYSNNKKIKKRRRRRRKERIWLFVFKEIQHRQKQLNQRSPLLIHALFLRQRCIDYLNSKH